MLLLDVDPGCDDAVALAVAAGHDGVDLAGVSTVAGNTTVGNATRNARAILELGGVDVPVARGCDGPLVGDLTTAEWIHGEGGIRGDLPEPSGEVVGSHAADFIVEQAREHGDDLTVAAVGPATNLAVALAKEPALPELVGDVWLMGGAAFAAGNVTPAAEANFHNDPVAARRVVADAAPRIVGLDVTDRATLSPDIVGEYRDRGGAFGVVADWLDYPPEVQAYEGGPAVHDAAVVAALVDPEVLAFEEYRCEVDTSGGPSHGALLADAKGIAGEPANAAVAVDIDADRFREVARAGIEAYAG